MSKEEIIEVIKKHIVENLDDIDENNIDPKKPLTEYGANSLDIIEIVSSSQRELQIKVPRVELTDIKNIDELAEKFLQYKS